jgi:sugar-specific transcriptional regulator TrmB
VESISQELVEKLLALGFSRNEAKVYACLIKKGQISIPEISDVTRIHRQDVYKILSRLEAKGLILRSIGKPCIFKLVPAEISLKRLISSIEHKEKKRLEIIKKNYVQLINSIKKLSRCKNITGNEIGGKSYLFIVDEPKFSKVDWSFRELKNEYVLVLPDGPFEYLNYLKEKFRILAKRKIKIQILILSKEDKVILVDAFKDIFPRTANFEIRTLQYPARIFFALHDKEAWIPVPSIGKYGALVTNAPEIVLTLTELFKKLWNDPQTKTRS